MNVRKELLITTPLLLMFTLSSCIERYWPDMGEEYIGTLVVEGLISNEPGPYTVKLSLSSSANAPEFIPLNNYDVMIEDDIGNIEVLLLSGQGTYQSAEEGMQGTIGRSYKLILLSPDGVSYHTAFEEINPPVEIKSVHAEVEYRQDTSITHTLKGYQFYLSTHEFLEDETFLLWNLTQTYEYVANRRGYLEQWYLKYKRCWKESGLSDFYTFKGENHKGRSIDRLPLNYVSTEYKELSIRYSLLVKQYSFSKEAYTYWTSVIDLNEGSSSLYTDQPASLRSNVININNAEEIVIGYFNVASMSQKRIFVDKPLEPFYYSTHCDTVSTGAPKPYCLDCRLSGGTIEKPEYWIDR